ncbi:hypothetical protein HZC34_03830 [Candidatus Saganbacteria bacterium]|nr:hypothetical protein [Candidatus Saganbacteria bacterium]
MPIQIVQFLNFNPIFKGLGLIILGLIALLFAYFMDRKWKEPKSFGFVLFIAIAIFILLFGLYILLFHPNWWALPYSA